MLGKEKQRESKEACRHKVVHNRAQGDVIAICYINNKSIFCMNVLQGIILIFNHEQ